MTAVDADKIRQGLGVMSFMPPRTAMDGQMYVFDTYLGIAGAPPRPSRRVIVTADPDCDLCGDWIHASISRPDRMPDYTDLQLLHKAVFGDGWAYQVFAPPAEHVNHYETCLHLFGRVDGAAALPDFTHGKGQI